MYLIITQANNMVMAYYGTTNMSKFKLVFKIKLKP